jgi:hypothetical protein
MIIGDVFIQQFEWEKNGEFLLGKNERRKTKENNEERRNET